jgi:hypothetical protein
MITKQQHETALHAVANLETARLALFEALGGTPDTDGHHNTSEQQEVIYPSEQHEILFDDTAKAA